MDARGRVRFAAAPVAGRASDLAAQRGGNPTRDRTRPYGDTPLGTFRIARVVTEGVDEDLYGSAGVIVLEPTAGEAALAEALGRFRLFVHGGPTRRGALVATSGALRMRDRDLAKLCTLLKAEDVRECRVEEGAPGAVRVVQGGGVLDDPPVRIAPPTSHHERRSFMRTGARFAAGAAGALLITRTKFVWAGDGGGSTGYDGGTNDSGEQVYFDPEPQAVYYDDEGQGITNTDEGAAAEAGETFDGSVNHGFTVETVNPQIVDTSGGATEVTFTAPQIVDTGEELRDAPSPTYDGSSSDTSRSPASDTSAPPPPQQVDTSQALDRVQQQFANDFGAEAQRAVEAQRQIDEQNANSGTIPPGNQLPQGFQAFAPAPPEPPSTSTSTAPSPSPDATPSEPPRAPQDGDTQTKNGYDWVYRDKDWHLAYTDEDKHYIVKMEGLEIRVPGDETYLNAKDGLAHFTTYNPIGRAASTAATVTYDVVNAGVTRLGTIFSRGKKKKPDDDGGEP